MREDPDARDDKDGIAYFPGNDDTRTAQAKRIVQDYASGLREMLNKLRKMCN
jgi:hypothetical protein